MTADIPDTLVESAIVKGVTEVLDTMAREKAEAAGRTPNPPLHSRPENIEGPHLVASVGFIGDLEGIINIHVDDTIATEISANMLGMTPAEVVESGVLSDSWGELANMIVGVFKNTIGEVGFVCKLTLPSIVRGTDFAVDHTLKSAKRYIYKFRCHDHGIATDIIIQQD
ncbi:chemotaxis protein CheX [Opitutus sp. ER46]|uniref:chemotaxis protein CheX n=1 Tax=Opitutus sp. ER46 TaxID=2161864 RepID=UPI001304C672|nr:chemotaxis protein CheX [Opitutus sp. ER46]